MACRNCKYFDENETNGSKGYCEWHNIYVYEDDNCNHFESSSKSSGCYLTTACCEYRNLSDDCYELTQLRKFRDNYLAKTSEGQQCIEEYYKIAPIIVTNIDKSPDKEKTYSFIYSKIVQCVKHIECNENEKVFELYKAMTISLSQQFLIN